MTTVVSGVPVTPREAQRADRRFFQDYPRRNLRIRSPIGLEFQKEFSMLGMHAADRERVIVARLPKQARAHYGLDFMRVPFLLFADETVEDRDDIIGPLLDRLMKEAAGEQSRVPTAGTSPLVH